MILNTQRNAGIQDWARAENSGLFSGCCFRESVYPERNVLIWLSLIGWINNRALTRSNSFERGENERNTLQTELLCLSPIRQAISRSIGTKITSLDSPLSLSPLSPLSLFRCACAPSLVCVCATLGLTNDLNVGCKLWGCQGIRWFTRNWISGNEREECHKRWESVYDYGRANKIADGQPTHRRS